MICGFEDGGTDKNTGHRAGGGEVEHVKLFIGSDQDGHQVIKSRSRWFGHVKRRDRG